MSEQAASPMAELITYCRAYHACSDSPKIFDDHLARELLGENNYSRLSARHTPPAEAAQAVDPAFAATGPDQAALLAWCMRTFMPLSLPVSRSRYAEDRLHRAGRDGVRQYLILGAGLDSYAFRRPESVGDLQIFEVDRPPMQQHKRSRLDELGWPVPEHLHLVPLDLTEPGALRALVERPGYDPSLPTFVSWLGVTYYLPRAAVFDTLATVRALTPSGTVLVLDYAHSDVFVPEKTRELIRNSLAYLAKQGEPWITGLDSDTLAAELDRVGWALREDLGPEQIQERYFDPVGSPYRAWDHVHFATLVSQ